jgi:hypothetical protein
MVLEILQQHTRKPLLFLSQDSQLHELRTPKTEGRSPTVPASYNNLAFKRANDDTRLKQCNSLPINLSTSNPAVFLSVTVQYLRK